jgi:hypothetical protein
VTSTSRVLKGIKVRAAVRFHMQQIGILRRLLLFICHVYENIETTTIIVAVNNRLPLLFVKL